MLPPRGVSIKNRVRAVILLTSIAVLLATAAAFTIYEVVTFKARLIRNFSTLTEVMAGNCNTPLYFHSPPNAESELSAFQAETDVTVAVIYDDKSQIFAEYPTNAPANLLPARVENFGQHSENGALMIFRPIIQAGKQIGVLYVRASLRALSERLRQYIAIVTGVLISALIVAWVLSSLLQKRITDPILALTSAAKAVTERRDYSVRAPILTADELGTLTEAFNRMLAEIQEHQGRLSEQARLLDLSNDAIIVKDGEDRIVYWNHGAEELYGWSRLDALGKVKQDLLHTEFPDARERINEELRREGRWSGDMVQTRRDGKRIYVSTRWSLDPGSPGKPPRTLVTDTDISERKAFQAELEQQVAERTARLQETIGELEAFSYSVSHDMRAPLRAMRGYAEALQQDFGDRLDQDARTYLERICRAATRLDTLIQDVLAYSRVAKSEIELYPIDLEKLIDDILPSHPEFQPPRARLTVEKPLHKVLGHEAYLTQCFTNLVGNAVKFVGPGVTPEIRIRSERLNGKIRIWVEDNGIGIDPSHHDRIFQIFGQVYSEKKYGGTGIGLAIVRKAVQRMGGEIGLNSELGKGSHFWILLSEARA